METNAIWCFILFLLYVYTFQKSHKQTLDGFHLTTAGKRRLLYHPQESYIRSVLVVFCKISLLLDHQQILARFVFVE